MPQVVIEFLPVLLSGFVVNLGIALAAVVIALALGVPLSLLRRGVAVLRRPIGACIGLMQAVPTYVVMFFMVALLPRAWRCSAYRSPG